MTRPPPQQQRAKHPAENLVQQRTKYPAENLFRDGSMQEEERTWHPVQQQMWQQQQRALQQRASQQQPSQQQHPLQQQQQYDDMSQEEAGEEPLNPRRLKGLVRENFTICCRKEKKAPGNTPLTRIRLARVMQADGKVSYDMFGAKILAKVFKQPDASLDDLSILYHHGDNECYTVGDKDDLEDSILKHIEDHSDSNFILDVSLTDNETLVQPVAAAPPNTPPREVGHMLAAARISTETQEDEPEEDSKRPATRSRKKQRTNAATSLAGTFLAAEGDDRSLSKRMAFARKHMLVWRRVTQEDMDAWNSLPRNAKKVSVKQVGIECAFCSKLPINKRTAHSSISFPRSKEGIQQDMSNIMNHHLPSCERVPKDLKKEYDVLKKGKSPHGSTQHIISAATKCGLVDKRKLGGITSV